MQDWVEIGIDAILTNWAKEIGLQWIRRLLVDMVVGHWVKNKRRNWKEDTASFMNYHF
jgi:hypothetical protein